MKGTIRSFSIGLFSAGVIIIVATFLTDQSPGTTNAEEIPFDDMVDVMKEKGYRVVTEEEYISVSLADQDEEETEDSDEQQTEDSKNDDEKADQDDEKSTSDDKDKDKKEDQDKKDEKEDIEEYTLNIKDGMPSSDIGNLLEENNIIDDGREFNFFLIDEGYDEGVQLGKFKVTSDMDFEELAEAITR